MFAVDELTAEAIRRAWDEGGELSGIVEFKRHFPLISDHAKARECVRIIAGWQKRPPQPPQAARPGARSPGRPSAWRATTNSMRRWEQDRQPPDWIARGCGRAQA